MKKSEFKKAISELETKVKKQGKRIDSLLKELEALSNKRKNQTFSNTRAVGGGG